MTPLPEMEIGSTNEESGNEVLSAAISVVGCSHRGSEYKGNENGLDHEDCDLIIIF